MKRTTWMAGLAAALVVGSGTAYGAETSDGTIRACADQATGALRLTADGTCGRSDVPLTWNQTGPVGPVGPAGPTGPTGPQGPAGTPVKHGQAIFRANGTWTAPAGVTSVVAELWGGGSSVDCTHAQYLVYNTCMIADQGFPGGYVRRVLTVVPGTAYAVKVGAGGSGGNSTNADYTEHPGSPSTFNGASAPGARFGAPAVCLQLVAVYSVCPASNAERFRGSLDHNNSGGTAQSLPQLAGGSGRSGLVYLSW